MLNFARRGFSAIYEKPAGADITPSVRGLMSQAIVRQVRGACPRWAIGGRSPAARPEGSFSSISGPVKHPTQYAV